MEHDEEKFLILIHDLTSQLIKQIVATFTNPSTIPNNPPNPFILGASHFSTLVPYDQWREAHLGDHHASLALDTFLAYKMFLGYPLVMVESTSLQNYFLNLSGLPSF